MFDVGFWELSLIGVLALVILGPERLPVAARTLGRWVRRGRRFVSNFGEELTGDSSIADLREEVRKMRSEIEEQTRETINDVEEVSNDDNNTDASGQDSSQPRSMYEFSLDDVDNAPGADYEPDNQASVADESVDVSDDLADESKDSTVSAPESSVEASATAGESIEPIDAQVDVEDEEALYARARRRYAGVDETNDLEQDTTGNDASSAQAKSPTLNE